MTSLDRQVSTFTALVAAALPDGARVLAAEEDFTSVRAAHGGRHRHTEADVDAAARALSRQGFE